MLTIIFVVFVKIKKKSFILMLFVTVYEQGCPVILGVTNSNSVALVRERTLPTERPPLVGEVSANVCR
jgi:hypothetical protein